MCDYAVDIQNISKSFYSKDSAISALDNVSFRVEKGEIIGIIGFSGAGKSTLIKCLNALERPDSGNVVVCGENIHKLKGNNLLNLRRRIGMVFQNSNLMQQRTVLKNVLFPLEIAKADKKTAKKRALELLEVVGLSDREKAYPSQLSGGQQQRVAIARALALTPQILLCDEATSALDPQTTLQILKLIKDINTEYKITVIIVSHQIEVIKNLCSRVVVLGDGKVCEMGKVEEVFENPTSEATKKLLLLTGGNA